MSYIYDYIALIIFAMMMIAVRNNLMDEFTPIMCVVLSTGLMVMSPLLGIVSFWIFLIYGLFLGNRR